MESTIYIMKWTMIGGRGGHANTQLVIINYKVFDEIDYHQCPGAFDRDWLSPMCRGVRSRLTITNVHGRSIETDYHQCPGAFDRDWLSPMSMGVRSRLTITNVQGSSIKTDNHQCPGEFDRDWLSPISRGVRSRELVVVLQRQLSNFSAISWRANSYISVRCFICTRVRYLVEFL